ncbi:site-specific integrase [Arboricoccus pini]|nr:site-specific integrase [Arboricoccus pini]
MASPWRHPSTGVYHLRRRIPLDLRAAFHGRDIVKRSLRTKDPAEAKRLFVAANAELEAEFEAARKRHPASNALSPLPAQREITSEDVNRIGHNFLVQLLEEDEGARSEGLDDRYFRKLTDTSEWVQEIARISLARGDLSLNDDNISEALAAEGLSAEKDSPAYRAVGMAILKAFVTAGELESRRNQGEVVNTPDRIEPPGVTPSGPTLSQLCERWAAATNPTGRTAKEWAMSARRFDEITKSTPIEALTVEQIEAYRDSLLASGKHPATAKKLVGAVRTLLNFATEKRLIPANPAASVRVKVTKAPLKRRLPFDADDLRTIFKGFPVFTQRERPKAGGGEAAYWLPLLALYTGARLEELGQALLSDVRTSPDGIPYLDINDDDPGKSLKTISSRRRIPLHPRLIELGFGTYADDLRSKGQVRLFPELQPDVFGKWTGNWSKWWGRYSRQHGMTDPRKVFHSFRHAFKDACRDADIPREVHDALTGHSEGRNEGEGYGTGFSLKRLHEAICKLSYKP